MSEVKKVYVTSEYKTILTCPKCQKSKRTDFSKFMGFEKQVKLKCKCSSCHHQFSVILERRRSIRKDVNFPGSVTYKDNTCKISIKDISKHGLKIFLHNKMSVEAGTTINVEFTLDDPGKSPVRRDVRIKKIYSPQTIGCEYLNGELTGNLAKYFMFYY